MTRIIIDSTIDLPEQYRRQVHIVPLTIHFGTEELLDGVDIDRQRFYERLVESDVLPTTSQPSPDAFAQLFDQVEAAGDSAVVLTISHKLSGTYQSACIAAEGRERIFVVDTMSAPSAPVSWPGTPLTTPICTPESWRRCWSGGGRTCASSGWWTRWSI